jgi:hypothetical protein
MRTLRVLSLDGGGMRGLYTATYLDCLVNAFAKRRKVTGLDFGKSFDLIVGTSTGAILGCAAALGIPLSMVIDLYRKYGRSIFTRRLPNEDSALPITAQVLADLAFRKSAIEEGAAVLRTALESCFGNATLADVHKSRGIGLAIPAVELENHHSFVFKTPHLAGTMHRDDHCTLVDVCMASTAAPIYRSLAAVNSNATDDSYRVFADGGLWANNPVLVGLIDALGMTTPDDEIEIYCMGTCPRPSGELISRDDLNRGLAQWHFGGDVAVLAMDAQEFAYDNIARLLSPHLKRRSCHIMRFPRGTVPASMMHFLDLDETRDDAYRALMSQACTDGELTNSLTNTEGDETGMRVKNLFMDMPIL